MGSKVPHARVPLGRLRDADVAAAKAGADLHPSSLERAAFMIYASATTRGQQGGRAISRADLEEVLAAGEDRTAAVAKATRVFALADADRDGVIQADEFLVASRLARLNLGLLPAAFRWQASVADVDGDQTITPADLARRQLWRDGVLGREDAEAQAVAGPAVSRIFCSGEVSIEPGSSELGVTAGDLRPELSPGESVLVTVAHPVVAAGVKGRTILLSDGYTGPSGKGFQLLRLAPRVRLGRALPGMGRAGSGSADTIMVRPALCALVLSGDGLLLRGGMVIRLDGSEDRSAARSVVLERPHRASVLSCDAHDGKLTLTRPVPAVQLALQDPTVTEGGATGGARTGRSAGGAPDPDQAAAAGDASAGAAGGKAAPSPSPSPAAGASPAPAAERAPLAMAVDTAVGPAPAAAVEVVGIVLELLPRSPFEGTVEPTGAVVDAETGALSMSSSGPLGLRVRQGDVLFLADPLGPAVVRSVQPGVVALQRPVGLVQAGGPVSAGRILKLNHSDTVLRRLPGMGGSRPGAPFVALSEREACTAPDGPAPGLPAPGPVLPGDIVSLSSRLLPVRRCGAPGATAVLFLGASYDGTSDTASPIFRVVPLPSVLIPMPAFADATSAVTRKTPGGGLALSLSHDLRGLVVPGHLLVVDGDPPRPVAGVFRWGVALAPGAWEKGTGVKLGAADGVANPAALRVWLVPAVDSSDEAADLAAQRAALAISRLEDAYSGKALGGPGAAVGFSMPHPPTEAELGTIETVSRRTIAGGAFPGNPYLVEVVRRSLLTHKHLDIAKDGPVTAGEYRAMTTKDANRGFVTVAAPVPHPELASFDRDQANLQWCEVYPDGVGPGPKICSKTRQQPIVDKPLDLEPRDSSELAAEVSGDLAEASGSGGGGGGDGDDEDGAAGRAARSRLRKRGQLASAATAASQVSRAMADSMGSSSSSSSSSGGGGGGGFPDPNTGALPDKPEKDEPPDVFPAFFWFPSPFFWCPMDLPFAMVFCPTPIPQINILLKMIIPGIIRPVIDEGLSSFASAQDTMLTIIQGILPPIDGTGPRGGPPGFLQLSAAGAGKAGRAVPDLSDERAGSRAGKHQGSLEPALKQQMTDALVPQLLPDLLKPIVQHLHAHLHDTVLGELTASLRPLLRRTLAKALRRTIARGVAAAVGAEVRGMLRNSLRHTAEALLLSATRTTATPLARAIVHSTLRTVYGAQRPEMDQACAACEHTGFFCAQCARLSADFRAALRAADATVARLGPHYASYFADKQLSTLHKVGFDKLVESTGQDWPPLGVPGSRTNPDDE